MSRNRKRKTGGFQKNRVSRVSLEKNSHHIWCQSRYPKLRYELSNIVRVPVSEHTKFHILFTNRNPYEILDYLVEDFWGGQLELVIEYIEMKYKNNSG